MKRRERGVTTSSIIIYIIAVTFILSALSIVSGYFTKQISNTYSKNYSSKAYTSFMGYFTQDIQEKGNKVKVYESQTKTEGDSSYIISYILFTNGNKYTFYGNNKSVYKNDVKISENVDECIFEVSNYDENKKLIQIGFIAGDFKKTGDNCIKFYMNR